MREIALDTETTGFDPASGHRIVEIGCVEMVGHVRTGEIFHCYLNPERDMPQPAYEVHGLSREFLSDKPLFSQVADDLVKFLADATLVIHNAEFDMRFLNAELARIAKPALPFDRALCTLKHARKKFPGKQASLDALCKRFNVNNSARDKHGALLDAELLADMYREMMGGNQTAMQLGAQKTATQAGTSANVTQLTPRNHAPSEEELAAHGEFLEKIKKPAWES